MKKERKELFNLISYSTHYNFGYLEEEGNVLFNNKLNTFYLQLYGVRDYSDSKKGNLLPPLHGLLFPISSKGSLTEEEEEMFLFNNTLNTFYWISRLSFTP